ncbi:MAG TPA: alpha-L-arabinofuranosidase C-terminal domain-containing protein [Opitutaceae bacterium]|jgi:alpha-N-arabinofuranosidase
MKRFFALLLLAPVCALARTAEIKIDVDHVIDSVDPRIYGVFMEPIGRASTHFNTLYGPIYDPQSPLADAHGFRRDIIDAAKELQLTQMRWPGGNFTSTYDWKDGIGPRSARPKRRELAWGVVESNQVGTDEWMQLNQAIGSENIVCINGGTGTLEDARDWVEYCNAPVGTYWADKRAEYGHPAPYEIKIWDLGNEVDGTPWILAHKDADDYVKFAVEAAKIMRRSSPGTPLQFVACGASYYQDNFDWVDWNSKVTRGLYGIADYLSIHRYWEPDDDYYRLLGAGAMDLEEKLGIISAQLKTVAAVHQGKPMQIAFDEWAPRGRRGLQSTLIIAEFFNAFLRHADSVKMANYTLLTSILGRDPKTGATYKSPLFYTFKLYSTHCRGEALDAFVDCDTFAAGRYPKIPYLDVSSVFDRAKNQVVINVVNRNRDEAIATDIESVTGQFSGNATVARITGDGPEDKPYSYEARDSYPPNVTVVPASGPNFRCEFPPHSLTQIVVGVEAPQS